MPFEASPQPLTARRYATLGIIDVEAAALISHIPNIALPS
jgi:hypothetical protein